MPLAISTLGNDPVEQVAAACGQTPAFFQLYCPRDEELAASLVSRAEAAGAKAIVVTLDTWVATPKAAPIDESDIPF